MLVPHFLLQRRGGVSGGTKCSGLAARWSPGRGKRRQGRAKRFSRWVERWIPLGSDFYSPSIVHLRGPVATVLWGWSCGRDSLDLRFGFHATRCSRGRLALGGRVRAAAILRGRTCGRKLLDSRFRGFFANRSIKGWLLLGSASC